MKSMKSAVTFLAAFSSLGTACSGSGSPSDDRAASEALTLTAPVTVFAQPSLPGIAARIFVPLANHVKAPLDEFALTLWQPNPGTADGLLVPVGWNAGLATGLGVSAPATRYQAGFRDQPGATMAQIDGSVVGAYLNSADLVNGSSEYKLMITPEVQFGSPTKPFAAHSAILVGLDLEVPTATDGGIKGSDTYANLDLQLVDTTTGLKISSSAGMFRLGANVARAACNLGIDGASQSRMVNCAMAPGLPYLSLGQTSTQWQGVPWRGFKHFDYSISKTAFAAALEAIRDTLGGTGSLNPADYALTAVHLNAEMHYQTAPATLGWSMSNLTVRLQ